MIGRDTFSVLAPVLGPSQKNGYVTSSTVHGCQHDTKYVTFQLLLHAAFVADKNWGFMLEPARSYFFSKSDQIGPPHPAQNTSRLRLTFPRRLT